VMLTLKLIVVLVVLLVGITRTGIVVASPDIAARRTLQWLYGATVALVATATALTMPLAHG
jgi:hypothetical protein